MLSKHSNTNSTSLFGQYHGYFIHFYSSWYLGHYRKLFTYLICIYVYIVSIHEAIIYYVILRL